MFLAPAEPQFVAPGDYRGLEPAAEHFQVFVVQPEEAECLPGILEFQGDRGRDVCLLIRFLLGGSLRI
jgi:hypothetical protein